MRLADVTQEALVFEESEPVSKAIGAMVSKGRNEAVVTRGGEYAGMLYSKTLSGHDITNPEKAKIRNYIGRVPLMKGDEDPVSVAHSMVVNDYKSLPVYAESVYRVLTKLGLLGLLKGRPEFAHATAASVMHPPMMVAETETVARCIAVLRNAEVSRLVVADKQGGLAGIVSDTVLLRSHIHRDRPKMGEIAGEAVRLGGVSVRGLVEKNVAVVPPEMGVRQVVDRMLAAGTSTVVVERGGKPAGIITPKLILSILSEKREGVYVSISGIQQEDDFVKSAIDSEIYSMVQRVGKRVPIRYMNIYVRRYKEAGGKAKYSVKARLVEERVYPAKAHGWRLQTVVKECLDRLERIVLKGVGKG